MLRWCLAQGLSPSIENKKGATPLDMAFWNGQDEAAAILEAAEKAQGQ